MNDGIDAFERVDGLAVLGQIGDQLLRVPLIRIAGQIDADDVVPVLEEVVNDGAAHLACSPGDRNATHCRRDYTIAALADA